MSLLVSTTMRASEVRMHAWAASEKINANTKRFNNFVIVQHCDGTCLTYHNAFCETDPEDASYCWVFTEHHNYHAFAIDELECCIELAEVNRINLIRD